MFEERKVKSEEFLTQEIEQKEGELDLRGEKQPRPAGLNVGEKTEGE